MDTIKGNYAEAVVYATGIDDYAKAQIRMICDNDFSLGSKIRIMPDCHPGKVGPIGLTMTVGSKVVPQLMGIDIGCGMLVAKIKARNIEFQKLDKVIRENVPSGFAIRKAAHSKASLETISGLRCFRAVNADKALRSLGTLGGGNHFIEVDKASDGTLYLVIHSGSRNLGKQVAELYQHLAVELHKGREEYYVKREEIIRTYKEEGRRKEIEGALKELNRKYERTDLKISEALCWLYGSFLEDYLHEVKICQEYATMNRELMADIILQKTGLTKVSAFHTVHNYIDTDEMILRKGAIAAHKGEKVLIPINMRDGSILATGRGNPDWNYSAPHGAGRVMSRSKAKATILLEDFEKAMEGIYTTSVNEATIDESPMAYKSLEDIIDVVSESVDIIEVIKPIFNFKASEEGPFWMKKKDQ